MSTTPPPLDVEEARRTLRRARAQLLGQRRDGAGWAGELSSSAVATAAAVCALAAADCNTHKSMILRGLGWLAAGVNADGGWGDTPVSPSNLSATLLARAAFAAGVQYLPDWRPQGALATAVERAQAWLERHCGGTKIEKISAALDACYGADRSFSAPILAACALSGLWPAEPRVWRHVAALPFELAACPRGLWKWLRLPVVSYALPALVAVGQARHYFRPPLNPLTRAARRLLGARTLRVLEGIQPADGGFLEAPPLTAFVAMCLSGIGRREHPVVKRAVRFLVESVRPDGSWPIDTNLATWLTTLSINAWGEGDRQEGLPPAAARELRAWLLSQQTRREHPYTASEPGGWAWTDLAGGVPDADDTAGALLALRRLGVDADTKAAAEAGVKWLLDLQNRDGGIPTFCRGWGKLPFDRSTPDLTAHALRAWNAWYEHLPRRLAERTAGATLRAIAYLARARRPDGSWTPLWFGNELAVDQENPTYGTARVVLALSELGGIPSAGAMGQRGRAWLVSAQNADGGWGGATGLTASIEETALAVEALTCAPAADGPALAAADRGAAWLVEATDSGRRFAPAPIGLYFASLWYYETLYPVIFTVAALGRWLGKQ